MTISFTIARYPKWLGIFGILSMPFFFVQFFFNKKIHFYKLLGSGKNGTFSKSPDWNTWCILSVHKNGNHSDLSLQSLYGKFIAAWYKFFGCKCTTYFLKPISGKGLWDGKDPFEKIEKESLDANDQIAVLTRATIRINKLKDFWSNVDAVSEQMKSSPGFVFSIGIGEMPLIRQSTFSIWQNQLSMIDFAYKQTAHKNVIHYTRSRNWYSEELFYRFKIISIIHS